MGVIVAGAFHPVIQRCCWLSPSRLFLAIGQVVFAVVADRSSQGESRRGPVIER